MQPIIAADLTDGRARLRPGGDGAVQLDVVAIDRIVDEGARLSDWPGRLADTYREVADATVYREYRFLFLLGLAVAFSTVSLDLLVNPAMVREGLVLRFFATFPIIAIGLFAGARRWTPLVKIAMGASPIAFVMVLAHLAMHLPPIDAARYLLGATLMMAVVCLTTPFSIRGLIAFNALAVSAVFAAVAFEGGEALVRHRNDLAAIAFIGFATLPIATRIERLRRLNFLLTLRARLVSDQLVEANSALRKLSETDALTGIGNRRWFEDTFEARLGRGTAKAGSGAFIGLLMIDLDHFKPFNDMHGHQAGDSCLKLVARALAEEFEGAEALFARYGGEEFIAALCAEETECIVALAERARARVAATLAPIEGSGRAMITASIGVAMAPASAEFPREELIEMADAALYTVKNSGRNRVEVVEAAPFPASEEKIARSG